MRNRRQSGRNKSYLATMTVLGFISSTSIRRDLSRTFVRAAFTSGGVGSSGSAFGGGVGSHHHAYTNSRQFNNHVTSTKFALHAREPRMERSMSTAASDQELDSALDELLGEALKEAENPAADAEVGGRGHIEGSHPFPKELVETEEDFKDPKFLSTSNPQWTKMGVSQGVIDVLSHKGITHFTPVQAKSMRPVLAGRDVIGRSRTGTGKTLAFGIPALTRIVELSKQNGNAEVMRDGSIRMRRGRLPSMIVLCPTRELARQVGEELSAVCKPLGLFATAFHGGVSYDPQARALRQGIDVLVGTPGRVMDHLDRGNLNLSECHVAVLDEADEMLNMGFAEDVEVILEGAGSENDQKMQCLLFSATTPPWVREIGSRYQTDALSVDVTSEQQGARTATTVRHTAIQVPFGEDAKKAILEDIIAVEISKDVNLDDATGSDSEDEEDEHHNAIAAAARAAKSNTNSAMQQKIFGKTIVFTETKRECDELVSGAVFKTLTAQAIHGDIGQKQRDATLAAFRAGAFNVLVATDVAARGIDIKDVDLVIQFHPPRDTDTYVHRSGRTGRAGAKGISVLLFQQNQARDIVRIERSLGHGFKFELLGPPSTEAALNAAAKTSAIACRTVADETAEYFKDAARSLLANGDAEDVVARCLAAIARRTVSVESRSLLTGEAGFATVEMTNSRGRPISPGDVMFTVSKLSRMSQKEGGDATFDGDIGKIQTNYETGNAVFDMGVEDAKRLVEFSKDIDAGGAVFSLMKEMEIERGRNFGQTYGRGGGRGGRGGRGGGRFGGRGGGRGDYGNSRNFRGDRGGRGGGYNNNRYDSYGGGGYGRGGNRGSYQDGGRRSYRSSPRPQQSNEW